MVTFWIKWPCLSDPTPTLALWLWLFHIKFKYLRISSYCGAGTRVLYKLTGFYSQIIEIRSSLLRSSSDSSLVYVNLLSVCPTIFSSLSVYISVSVCLCLSLSSQSWGWSHIFLICPHFGFWTHPKFAVSEHSPAFRPSPSRPSSSSSSPSFRSIELLPVAVGGEPPSCLCLRPETEFDSERKNLWEKFIIKADRRCQRPDAN